MKHKTRLKRVEKEIQPAETLTAILPDWLKDDSYTEPVTTGRVIVPSGYLALDENGEVYFHK